jgi:UDP-N-acetylmuramoyl-tripeptide--D-alanyl-D-alanine ligase
MITLTLTQLIPILNAKLQGNDVQFTGCSTDTRRLSPQSLYVALRGDRFDGHDFLEEAQQQGAVAAVVETPVNSSLPLLQVADTRKALGMIARFWRQSFHLPIIAVTGSNGKTTVKEMLKAIFIAQSSAEQVLATQGNLNNDIGVPLTLFNLSAHHRYAVIEMGANHHGEIATLSQIAQPTIAVITQCAPAHLEGFKSIEGVAQAKGEIFSNLATSGIAVINQSDTFAPLWRQLASHCTAITFGLDETAAVTACEIQLKDDHSVFTLHTPQGQIPITLPLPGRHNVMNALAASAVAMASGCPLPIIQQGLNHVIPVKGRLQKYAGIHQSLLLDDTYNANPTSLHAALSVLTRYPAPHWLILGDMNELGTESATLHHQAGQTAKAMGIERLWAVGHQSRYAVEGFGQGAQHFANHADLLAQLRPQIPPQSSLLIKGSRGMQMEHIVTALRV